ncbi:hypothetical protein Hanom_Chr04g00384981 [Helianthus anomalus]
MSDIPDRPFPSGFFERPIFTYTNKEDGVHGQSMIGDHIEVSKNIEDSEGVGMEGGVAFGEKFLGNNKVERESRSHVLKGRRISINKTGRRVGQMQPKLLSVDNRPSSRKRARLDLDPNGLDPFVLDVLLGLNQYVEENTMGNEDNTLEGGVFSTEGSSQPLRDKEVTVEEGTTDR